MILWGIYTATIVMTAGIGFWAVYSLKKDLQKKKENLQNCPAI